MKYKHVKELVEQDVIILRNDTNQDCICRVDVNHKLFKLVYLKSKSVEKLIYDKSEEIIDIQVSELE